MVLALYPRLELDQIRMGGDRCVAPVDERFVLGEEICQFVLPEIPNLRVILDLDGTW